MYQRIMVAVDQSFMTSQVLQAAVELAKGNKPFGSLVIDAALAHGIP